MVHFVGAGPGAVDLITVRGAQLIKEADIIIYAGSLVNEELMNTRKSNTQIYNSASMTLEEVLQIVFKAEQEGKKTVRLHTGDPSIYSTIREQMVELNKHRIPYEVVPGVSSFSAAAATIHAEYTLPQVSQTLIITRAEGRTPIPKKEKLELLAKHQASMAIFLSAGLLKSVTQQLIAGGYASDSRAVLVYKASWKDEKVVHTTIENLESAAKEYKITKTALILVGGFLGDDYTRSLLYHPSFEHEYRSKNHEN